jgi:hypothetical protein
VDDRVHLFGIRHHGPGSALSLLAALDALRPAAVLIEGPPEADPLIPYVDAPGMRLPLALLAYVADDPSLAVFFPFAEFSPEWQAMRWALRHGRPARFIDWPAAMSLASRMAKQGDDAPAEPVGESPERDPLDRLAEVSGHADGEALWNALVESRGAGAEVFAAIEEAMTTLRAATDETRNGSAEGLRESRREAHMRLEIRKALKEHDGAIAVVVGAWHVPALRRKATVAEDRDILRDVARTKVEVSWVPWTETRLAAASGYGAGIVSPGWYGHLWKLYQGAPSRVAADVFAATWQAKVASLLRQEGQPAATASAIEAARLSVALAAMRGHAAPGLDEMRDASLAALCQGDETPFRLIESRLIVGEGIGVLDESVPQMPLAADLARQQRKLRLKPEAVEQEIGLDLRSEAGLAKSILLHRLELLGVPWGRLIDAAAGRGTFREIWRLAWVPELSVKLAEALVHGITVEQAAAGAATSQANGATEIQQLAELVRRCLLSGLSAAAEQCIASLQAAAVNAPDVAGLMQAVPSLVSILRYGTARKMPHEALSSLARALAVEVNANIGRACRQLDDQAAEKMRNAITGFDAAIVLLADDHLVEAWNRQLRAMVRDSTIVPLLAGLALRRLYDRAALDSDTVATVWSRALSPGASPKAAGPWLEGFLGSNAEIILQDAALLGFVDAWLCEQQEADFIEVVPMLRRAFGSLEAAARRRLLALAAKERTVQANKVPSAVADNPGFQQALPLLLTILGIKRHE